MTHSSLLISALAHIGVIVLAAVGLPVLHDPPDPVEVPIPVTVTMVSERTEAKAPLPPAKPLPPEAPAEPPEPEPVAAEASPAEPPPVETPPVEPEPVEAPPEPREEPVQVAALEPEPPRPEPPPEPEPEPVAAPLPPDPPEPEKAPPASDPKPPPLPQRPPQQQARAKPAPKPPPVPVAAPEDPPDELAALRQAALTNDLDTLRSAVTDKTPPPREEAEEAVFTISERHRLFRQLSRCWQTIPGLAPSERHIVVLQVALGPDRRVTSIEAVDGKGGRSYQAAKERAERALRHPFCEQLDVPPGKMALWKSLTLRFDPHRMQ